MMDIEFLENRYQVNVYAKLPIVIDRGEGCYVFDQSGNRYLDLYGGHAVTSTGHCHPKVVAAIREQAGELIFYSNATYNTTRARALEKLMSFCSPYHQAFLVNSGAEANENAIKLARAATGRKEVLSAQSDFHGRTYGSLSSTGIGRYREYLNTPVPEHRILPFNEIAEQVTHTTAAVIVEPIQSMGGVIPIPPSVLGDIAAACKAHGALFIFDEIQTGAGRSGSYFLYCRKLGLVPDLVTLAKGIASGYPVGALLVTEDLAKAIRNGDLGTTFGGGPLACAAMLATLQVIEEEDLLERVEEVGHYLRERLMAHRAVEEVRGEGLLIGVRFKGRTAKEVQKILFERGVLAGSSYDPAILRLMPALTLGKEDVEVFLKAIYDL